MNMKRQRKLYLRALRGLLRPKPLRIAVVNGMSASGVSATRTRGILRRAAGHADVLLCCEVFNVDVAAALGAGWEAAQHGARGSSEATTAVAVRRSRGRIDRDYGLSRSVGPAPAQRRALNLRSRSWVSTRLVIDPGTLFEWSHRFSAGHAPPKRAWHLWLAYVALTPRGIVGADWNKRRDDVAKRFRRRPRMVGLLGVLVPKWIPSTKAKGVSVQADHRVPVLTLWPERD